MASSSIASIPPLVTSSSPLAGRRPSKPSIRASRKSRKLGSPCVGAYWKAVESLDATISPRISTRGAPGKVTGSGTPPLNEMMSVRFARAMMSAISVPKPLRVRAENRSSQLTGCWTGTTAAYLGLGFARLLHSQDGQCLRAEHEQGGGWDEAPGEHSSDGCRGRRHSGRRADDRGGARQLAGNSGETGACYVPREREAGRCLRAEGRGRRAVSQGSRTPPACAAHVCGDAGDVSEERGGAGDVHDQAGPCRHGHRHTRPRDHGASRVDAAADQLRRAADEGDGLPHGEA